MYPFIENSTTPTATNPTTAGGCTGFDDWIGDAYCDDDNNNMDCSYDGGDCCGCNANTQYCVVCGCLDPNESGGDTTCPPTTTAAPTTTETGVTGGCTGVDNWIGDGYCDDDNNNMDCSYDGGDCCGCNANMQYCDVCGCLDPNESGGDTTCPPTTTGTGGTGGCTGVDDWIGDGYCDDDNNNMDCSYDGGDCCGCNANMQYCDVCGCLDPNESGGDTTCPPTTTGTGGTGGCTGVDDWIGDGYCDDDNNNMDCSYDGGDCCGCNANMQYCVVCGCLDPNGSVGGTTCPQTTTGTTTGVILN